MRLRSTRLHASKEVCRGPLAGDNRWWTTESWCQSVKPTLYSSFLMARILTCIRTDVVSSSSGSIYSQIKQRWRLRVVDQVFTASLHSGRKKLFLCFSTFTWITCYFYCAGVSNAKYRRDVKQLLCQGSFSAVKWDSFSLEHERIIESGIFCRVFLNNACDIHWWS